MTFTIIFLALVGVVAYIRLAPSDSARWHIEPEKSPDWPQNLASNTVAALTGGAALHLPDAALANLDAIAMATPRTIRLAGNVDSGRITWVTRSALWGFPDYTTAQSGPDGVAIFARLRFGKSDMGVNAARLRAWKSRL